MTIQLPIQYVSTDYPGYFWNKENQKLYSIKSGILRELYLSTGYFKGKDFLGNYYTISINGKSRKVSVNHLFRVCQNKSSQLELFPEYKSPKRITIDGIEYILTKV